MDFFERVGNFFTGGGWSSNKERTRADADRKRREDEERRRREELARQQKAAQAKQKPVAQRQQDAFLGALDKAAKAQAEQPEKKLEAAPRVNGAQLPAALQMPQAKAGLPTMRGGTPQENALYQRLLKEGKTAQAQKIKDLTEKAFDAKNKSDYENSFTGRVLNTAGDVGKLIAGTAVDMGSRVVETVDQANAAKDRWLRDMNPTMSKEEKDARNRIDSNRFKTYRDFRRSVIDDFFFSGQKNDRGETMSQETDREADEISRGKATGGTVFSAAMKSLDLAGFIPVTKVSLTASRNAGKLADDALDDVVSGVREQVGRELTQDEVKIVREELEKQITNRPNPTNADNPPKTKDVKTVEDAPQEAQDVATSYQNVVNAVNKDKNLTPQQQFDLIQEARKRHIELLKQVDQRMAESAKAQKEAVDQVAEAQRLQEEEQARLLAEAQAQRQADTAPEPQQVVQEQPAYTDPEFTANNPYDDTQRLVQEQEALRDAQKKTHADYLRKLVREVYDPQATTQGIDNSFFKMLQEGGELRRGQRALDLDQSVTGLNTLIYNPTQQVDNAIRKSAINRIKKELTRSGKEKQFELYRLYKDELWRIGRNGEENTLPVAPEEMAAFVRKQEAENPTWVQDNAELREISLDNFRRRVDAGIDDPEFLANAEQNPFYTPRSKVEVKDAVTPQSSNIANRSAKETKARQDNPVGTIESPLDLYERDIRNTITGEAVQKRAEILRQLGFNVAESAEDAYARKQIIKEMEDWSNLRQSLGKEMKNAKGDVKKLQAAVKKAEDKVVASVTRRLEKAKGKDDDIFSDVVNRDPRYEIEKKQIMEQKLENLTPKERREQIKYDLNELEKKYPTPEQMKRDQILEFARSVTNSTGTTDDFARADEALAAMTQNKQAVEDFQALIRQTKQENSDLFEELSNYTTNPKTGLPQISYKYKGATGKIDIPAHLAREWAGMDKLYNHSPVGRVVDTLGNVQKTFWTGMFNPVFQAAQTIRNFGQMFTNADGLSAFSPSAVAQFLKSILSPPGGNTFRNRVQGLGATYENATKGIIVRKGVLDDISNEAGVGEFLSRNPIRSISDLGRMLNNTLAHLSNAQRDQVIAGAIARTKRLNPGISEEEATKAGVNAAVKVFGDFNRVSTFARVLDGTFLPYAGATQAGVRADLRAFKEKPAETAVKYGMMVSAMAGIVLWNMQNGAEEYYKTMREEGEETDFENSLVFAIGDVSRNEDGSWNNLIKIPLTPDFRPLHRATIETVEGLAQGSVDAALYAQEAFNFFTGDIGESVYDPDKTDKGRSPFEGAFTAAPALNVLKIMLNRDLFDGGEKVDADMYNKPRTEQAYDSTSGWSRGVSNLTGGAITPIQSDQILGLMGNTGRSLKEATDNKDENGGFFDPIIRMFTAGKSMSDKQRSTDGYLNGIEEERYNITDLKQRRAFEMLHEKRTAGKEMAKELGIEVPEGQSNTGILDSATKALVLLGNEEVLNAELNLVDRAKARGEAVNPLFDRDLLTPEQRNAVLTYRQGKIYNSAGQNRDKNDETAFTALGLDEPWYQEFKNAENAFYNSLPNEDGDTSPRTFSGDTKALASPELQAKLDYYYTLPRGTGDRSRFLRANPDVLDHWEKQNDFTNSERAALGFKPITEEDDGGKSGYGSGGGDWTPFGLMGELLNIGDNVKFAPREKEAKITNDAEELEQLLRSLMGAGASGGANVTLGGESRGQNG